MYTYTLHKSNATPVLSSRAHLGAHKRAAPFRSMFSCKGEEGNIGMLVWGGEGAGGGGEGGEGRGVVERILVFPPTDSPNPLEEAKLHRPTLGLIYGFTVH